MSDKQEFTRFGEAELSGHRIELFHDNQSPPKVWYCVMPDNLDDMVPVNRFRLSCYAAKTIDWEKAAIDDKIREIIMCALVLSDL